jgi:glutamate decarboxylase
VARAGAGATRIDGGLERGVHVAGAEVAAQYSTFLRLGFDGFRRVQQACRDHATWIAGQVAAMGPFELVSDGSDLPVFAFRAKDDVTDRFTVYDVSARLRQRGWLVPAYRMPEGLEDMAVLRVVVRNGFSRELAVRLVDALRSAVDDLERAGVPVEPHRQAFHH